MAEKLDRTPEFEKAKSLIDEILGIMHRANQERRRLSVDELHGKVLEALTIIAALPQEQRSELLQYLNSLLNQIKKPN